jgi:hypothetical protein
MERFRFARTRTEILALFGRRRRPSGPPRLQNTVLGNKACGQKGVDKTGQSISDKPDFRGKTAFDECGWVVNEKKPLASRDLLNLQDFGNMLPFQ